MNEQTYRKLMLALTKELERAQNTEPYNPIAYNHVVDKMNEITHQYGRSRLLKQFITLAVLILLFILFAFLTCGVCN